VKFDIKKFFSGFNLLDGGKFGKILYIAVLITIGGFILWSAFIKPTNSEVQKLNQKLNLDKANIETLNIDTGNKKAPSTRWSLLSIRIWAKD